MYVAKKADNLKEGVELAKKLIDSKKAFEKLEDFIRCSNEA